MILLKAYNLSTTFTIKEFSFRVLYFLICLNPDSLLIYTGPAAFDSMHIAG